MGLKQSGQSRSILIGMEATGHYWYSLHDYLCTHGYQVVVINPLITSEKNKKSIRKGKTDKRDAKKIAQILVNAEYHQSIIPTDEAMNCRQLTRLRYRMIDQKARIKQFIRARLHPVWPEFERLFCDPFGVTARRLLQYSPTPRDVLGLTVDQIHDLIRQSSRGRFGLTKAQEIRDAANHSVGIQRGLESLGFNIRLLVQQLDAFEPVIDQLDTQIQQVLQALPSYLLSLPGATPESVVSLYGEIHPIESFKGADQIVAFAGLDPVVVQSGEYPHDAATVTRHISKRGCPFLRHTLWLMAQRAICQPGPFRQFWLKKRSQGKHHLSVVTMVAGRLCNIIWRIMTDKREYLPEGPPAINLKKS
jgi:transposase